jgi:D-aminopeptidase
VTRLRELGITIGELPPGPLDAITDVEGVAVGVTTLIEGDSVRTGVTVIVPPGDVGREPLFAGCHRLNGNGELTGLEWVRESGLLTTPVAITSTHSVGVVRDALVEAGVASGSVSYWSLPVVGETWDGTLNDANGFHVRPEHVHAALASAAGGPVPEGNVGGGTGMICHGFKGGAGTASRVVDGWTVGALVQANHGGRSRLAVDGVPVGREIGPEVVPLPGESDAEAGSIIVVLATDAPLLPHQCERLAQRAGLGIARAGGSGAHSSGDLFLAFSTANRGRVQTYKDEAASDTTDVTMLADEGISSLFWAAIESVEEAIANALVAAETMTGKGVTVHALPHDLLVASMRKHGRLDPASSGL